MRDLEARFQQATRLPNRAHYKMFYGQIRPAPVLTLGINPAGSPAKMNADGRTQMDGTVASASAGYFENGEHDIVDCDWPENTALRRLLVPYLGGDVSRIRTQVVQTNLAFRRSANKADIDIRAAMSESAPFLTAIIDRVQPKLILLTGVALSVFNTRYAKLYNVVAPPEQDVKINQVIFAAARTLLRSQEREALVVQVAHASQFGWTYERYAIARRIRNLLEV